MINEHFDNVDHFEVPGVINVVDGSDVHIDNLSVSDGSPSDSTSDFETRNPISRETASVEYAGESLRLYSLADYTMQIKQNIVFMTLDAFSGD